MMVLKISLSKGVFVLGHDGPDLKMLKSNTTTALSDKAQRILTDLSDRIGGWKFAKDVWDRLLTSPEREQLGGDLDVARSRYRGIVGMWTHVRGVSVPRAIVEVAYEIGLLETSRRDWLFTAIGEEAESKSKTDLPVWDRATGDLSYRGQQIRTVRSMEFTNVATILDLFQGQGWPRSIAVPDEWSQSTVHETVRSLNKGLKGIKFHARNGARNIYWD